MARKARPPSAADLRRIEAASHPAKRTKRRADVPGTAKLARRPDLTPLAAIQLVQMLHAGIPADKALVYFSVEHYDACTPKQRAAWLSDWCNSPRMLQATRDFLKGEWHELDPDARLQIALDKHLAELAYLLYTTDYRTAEPPDVRKLDTARDAITAYVKESAGGEETPFIKAMRDMLEGKMGDAGLGMPIVGAMPVTPKES